MTEAERVAWRALHVREAPEEDVLVTVNLNGWHFSRHARSGDVTVITPTYRTDTMHAANFATTLLLGMDELAEVAAVLTEYDDLVGVVP